MQGKTISHYRIIEKLGEGGMGVVYKAEDTKLHRTVALKFLSSRMLAGEEERKRFMHEAQAAASLNHPNICTIHEIDEADGQSFIVMEYVEGKSLKTLIGSGPLKLDRVRGISMQIAEGLLEAHSRRIIHRDIKPANIMITDKGRVKIMDFGLAKSPDRTQLTQEGTTLGTVAYMSPEQGCGVEIDSRTDIWALGVLIYEMVTGMQPFRGDYEQAVIYSILNEDPEPITALRTGVPAAMERIVDKAMAKDPRDRYQHADELTVDLRSLETTAASPASVKVSKVTGISRVRFTLAGAGVIVIAGVLMLIRSYMFPGQDRVIDSIAVLPLENHSRDPDQEYFVDGMTEALIAELAKIDALKVISRTSVMRYKDTRKSIPEIARELDVDVIVEGSVMQVGGRIRITAQLIEAESDRHIWAENYERDLHDVFVLQRNVAHAIADEINIKLSPGNTDQIRRVDPDAYQAYLKGRYLWNKRTEQDLEKSIEYFEEAVRIDPDYAQAYAAVAEAYVILSDWGFYPPREADRKVKEFAQKALSIDSTSAEAYSALGLASHDIGYDWEKSEEYYKKAILLNPNYATAHQWYSHLLSTLGRHDEAIAQAGLAHSIDPLSLVINQSLSIAYYLARRYDEAIEHSRKTLELDKNFWSINEVLHLCYLAKGMIPEALEVLLQPLHIIAGGSAFVEELDRAYKTSDYDRCYRLLIENGDKWLPETYNRPFYYAIGYAYDGEKDKAFECLEEAYELRSRFITTIAVEPALDNLRSDPRFDELLGKIGLK